jgi:cobalt/nickel transport system ATP-binding protein
MEPVLHIDCVSHSYPDGTMGTHKLCLRVFPKEIVAICGPNGAGKSTLLEALNGILIPSEGRIMLEGETID